MRRKKNKILLAIVIVLIIVLVLLAGIAYCYFATDIFKTNKQLFFEYVGQISNTESGFAENSLKQYFEKKGNTPYTNEGEFSLQVTADGEMVEEYENVNNFNISFSGQVDKVGNKTMQDISLNYSEEVNFPFSYKQIAETIGLQTKYVSSKFVAAEMDNLAQSTNTIIDTNEITQSIENLAQSPFTTEDLKHIKETYMNVLNTQLQDAQFTKIEEANYVGYSLKLTGVEIKNILQQLLETLKNDELTLNKINEYLEAQEDSEIITTEDIDDFIQEIAEDESINEENITITVYGQNGETKKIVLETEGAKIQLEKVKENNLLKYTLTLGIFEEEENATITLSVNYEGLGTMQTIDESYEVGLAINNEVDIKCQLNNNITFVDEISIEEFTDENTMMLTDYDSETVNNFLASVVERIQTVNKNQMEELGLEENENPIIQILSPLTGALIYNQAQDAMDTIDINALEISTFNEKFQMYEGTNIKGTTVNGLLTTIARNNGLDDSDDILNSGEDVANHLITEINFNGEEYEVNEQNITFIKNEMKLEEYYRVEFEMDEDTGAIYRVVINEKVG